jgi:hypothetical protein
VPPRKPHNVARKRVAKKLMVTETTSEKVNSLSRVVEYLSRCCVCRRKNFVARRRSRLPTP